MKLSKIFVTLIHCNFEKTLISYCLYELKYFFKYHIYSNSIIFIFQLVHKVKSHFILDQLSPWGTDYHNTSTVYEDLIIGLKKCLDKIEVCFILSCIWNTCTYINLYIDQVIIWVCLFKAANMLVNKYPS